MNGLTRNTGNYVLQQFWALEENMYSVSSASRTAAGHARSFTATQTACVQEGAMREVLANTHWVPPYWRGKAHSSEVRSEFSGLFQYQMLLYLEEALSVVLLPWLCILLSRSSHDIVSFLHKVGLFFSHSPQCSHWYQ